MLLLLKSAIIPNPITVSPDTTVAEALKQMVAPTSKHPDDVDPPQSGYAKIWADCVVVLEQGRFLGIVTAQEWWPCHLVPGPTADFGDPGPKAVPPALDQVLVRDVMVSPGAEIRWSEGNDMATLLALFQQSGSHYLPVLGKADEFLGMVSRDSLGYAALQHLALQATEPQHSHQQQDGSMAHPGEEELRANSDFSMPPSHCRFAWANSGTHSNGAANAANHSTTHGADGLTLALEQQFNARITELEARVNWEKVLTDLAAQICSSLDLQTILDITVQQVQQVLGCDRLTIWQFETEDCAIAVAEALGCTGVSFLGERIETTGLHPASEKASPDIHITQFSAYYPDALVHLQSQDKLLVPLFCGDSLWGLLQVNGRQVAQPWADKDVDLLQFLS
ncbi:MAG: GAF domain-containing protein, partial [Leptolyngbyaceae bacterium]|nr:GAF domain-containing protein [Leptolyngbyaceae bacterium]